MESKRFQKTTTIFFLFLVSLLYLYATPLDEEFKILAQQIAQGIGSIENKKVGVLAFPYVDGKVSSGSSIVAERMTTTLVGKKKIQVIERRLISKLLQEKYLSQTGIVDSSEVKKIGSILGVEAIVTGTLIDLDDGTTEINARLIRVESGEILSASAARISRTWNDKPLFQEIPKRPEAKANRSPVVVPTEESLPKLKATQLSNENFPPERRKYRGQDNIPQPVDSHFDEAIPNTQEPKKSPKPSATPYSKPNFIEKRTEGFKRERF